MLTVTGNSIFLTRGDSAELTLSLTDSQGSPYDFSGDTVRFGVKRNAFDAECVIEKTVTDGKITFAPEDTESLEFGDYLYDVEVRHTVNAGEENEAVQVYTPIAAAKFSLGYNVL